jgi:hypothetical protein
MVMEIKYFGFNEKDLLSLSKYFENFTADSLVAYRMNYKNFDDEVMSVAKLRKNFSNLKPFKYVQVEHVRFAFNLKENPERVLMGEYKDKPIRFELRYIPEKEKFRLVENYEPEYEKIQQGGNGNYKVVSVSGCTYKEYIYRCLLKSMVTVQEYKQSMKRIKMYENS